MFSLDVEEHTLNSSKRYKNVNIDFNRILVQYKITRNCVQNAQTIIEVLSNICKPRLQRFNSNL